MVEGRRPPAPLVLGVAIVAAAVLIGLLAPWIAPYDPIAHDTGNALEPPGSAHPFGTDNFGRDVFSRVIWGTRIDLQMGVIGVVFPFMIGTIIGSVSGYLGGWVDAVFMRIVDVVLAFPFLVLMLAIIAILGPGLMSFYIAMALVGWVSYARLIRSQTLVVKHSDFVDRSQEPRLQPWADHVAAHPSQCAGRRSRVLDVGCGSGDPVGSSGELSGPRRPAADRGMGDHGRRRAELHHHRMVDHRLPGLGDRRAGVRLQHARRRIG